MKWNDLTLPPINLYNAPRGIMNNTPSVRAEILTRRTYNRPLNNEGTQFEAWEQTVDRVISHQAWLWERALGRKLNEKELSELGSFKELMLSRKALTSGRTLWLGGTDIAKTRESSQFNCSAAESATIHDIVDKYWLLLQGCGVGFEPIVGTLNGFTKPIPEVVVIPSIRESKGGRDHNVETYEDGVWTISIGDSAEAWAKAVGKVLAGKKPANKLILDFSQIRPAGLRLSGYGWISSGYKPFSEALVKICEIMNRKAGMLLSRIDLLDIHNHLGTTLSSRRSAEIAFVPFEDEESEAFAMAKKDYWKTGNNQRSQSNNSLLFNHKPTKLELRGIFQMMLDCGGSEPGFYNAMTAKKRAPWFRMSNPCGEILLGNKSFCNLVEIDLAKFNGDFDGLLEAHYLVARANYRQTCVNLDDGILQRSWHELNEFLRLCGVGVTGVVRWDKQHSSRAWKALRDAAHDGCNSMADELGLPRSKAITTVKPSGTLSKIMDTTEGVHKPLGKYIFNNVSFSKHDPILVELENANYRVFDHPFDNTSKLVTLPISYEDVKFDKVDGKDVNVESAIVQLDRYKMLMDNYVDHNCSITVSYDPSEVGEIVDWLDNNWDSFVGVSFLLRNDPTKTAEDLGYPYLPQEVVTKERFYEYQSQLKEVNLNNFNSDIEIDTDECQGGVCPVK